MDKRKGPPNRKENGDLPIGVIGDHTTNWQQGLTKREYFAGLAMQSLLTNVPLDVVAKLSVQTSDDLLKELDKPKSE